VYFLRHAPVGGKKLLDDAPGSVEDLHERPIVREGANDEIPLVIFADSVAASLGTRNDADPKTSRRFKMLRINLDARPNPLVRILVPVTLHPSARFSEIFAI
jgi:hypothetical protein